jgi:NAD(P)-dependent dehydrogenase (short-subunit alcohol dehydrogenase family)/catechol 2,3-dioxygenase-like lactoylglutathione lyase family enzyme
MASPNARTALITGASRGLGRALARTLAARGWTLIIDARAAELLEAARAELAQRTTVVAIPGDVADPAHREALAHAARDLGGLQVLVNNASILGPSPQPHLLTYPLATLARVYEVNSLAPLGLIQAVQTYLASGARLLNITSDAGIQDYAGWGGYGSSKAALEQLSHVLAAERPDWRVYWVDPGDMRTEMHQQAFPGEDISDRPLPESSVPGLLALLDGDLPSGRYEARRLPTTPTESPEQPPAGGHSDELSVVLTAENFDRTLALYHDGLGLPIIKAWDGTDGRGAILAVGRGTIEIQDHTDAATTDRIEIGIRLNEPIRLALGVNDVAARASALAAHNARPLGAVTDTPWGRLTQRLRTPDGIQLTLFQPGAEEA